MKIKIKKKYFYSIIIFSLLLTASLLVALKKSEKEAYIDKKGLIAISHIKPVDYKVYPYEKNENYTVKKVAYLSSGKDIYGFLLEPNNKKKFSGVVLLPGAGVDKVSELELAKKIAGEGYAVITIDQRGVGETAGYTPSLEEDYESYSKGSVPVQHLMVMDSLKAAALLKKEEQIKQNNIVMVGESLGGRIAIIAAAVDKSIKGVIAISAAGFHYDSQKDEKSKFIMSLDPDNYAGMLSPRKMVMMHNTYDRNIPYQSAMVTFKNAKEPKLFILVNDSSCNHGYCHSMFVYINSSLAEITGRIE